MAKRLTSVLGIDVGSHHVKVCEMKTMGREPAITALGVADTPEGAVDHTGVFNPEAVGLTLKQAIAECGATAPFAIVSIAGQASVLVRTLEVPKMNPSELREHMEWEIHRNIPFAESTVVSDFRPLGGDDPNSPNMDVVMAIAPQSAIDTMIACVRKAGRQPAAIDVEPLSLARSLQFSYEDALAGRTVCLVEVGAKTTSINIYRGSKLLMPRQVPVGGDLFTSAIADAMTLSAADSEKLKRERLEIPESASVAPLPPSDVFAPGGATQEFQAYNPFADEPASPYATPPAAEATDYGAPLADTTPEPVVQTESTRLYHAVAPVLDEFVAEIRRSIDYFRSRGGEVDTVLLAGGGSKIRGLERFLQSAVAVECDAYDPFRRLNLNVRRIAPTFLDEYRPDFAVAVGNALHIFVE